MVDAHRFGSGFKRSGKMKKRIGLSKVKKRIFWVIFVLGFSLIACNFPNFFNNPEAVRQPQSIVIGPEILFQEPAPGQRIPLNESFNVYAVVRDEQGITRAELWIDDTLVLTKESSSPNGLTFLYINQPMQTVRTGDYALKVRAFNSKGMMVQSAVHHVVVFDAGNSPGKVAQYIVPENGTLDEIASNANTTPGAIQQANPSISPNAKLAKGQIILVPAPPKRSLLPAKTRSKKAQPPKAPHPNAPQPPKAGKLKSTVKIQGQVFDPDPVIYGTSNPSSTKEIKITAIIAPVSKVAQVTSYYAYRNQSGGWVSVLNSAQMQEVNGDRFEVVIKITDDLEKIFGKNGGFLTAWVEVTDVDGLKVSNQDKGNTVQVIYSSSAAKRPVQQPGILPGLLPGVDGANQNVEVVNGAEQSVISVFFPQPEARNPPANSTLKIPTSLKLSLTGDCKVKLDWIDNATSEDAYYIYRLDPGMPAQRIIAKLGSSASSFNDKVPQPGKYTYTVAAGQGQSVVMAFPIGIIVPYADKCKPLPEFMQAFFQPLQFTPKDGSLAHGFLNVTIKGLPTFRLPRGQQTYYRVGNWNADWLGVVAPAPEIAYTDTDQLITLEVQGNASANPIKVPPVALGQFVDKHPFSALISPNASNQVHQGQGTGFTLNYKYWFENWVWTGKATNPSLPAPTNLKLNINSGSHDLTWDYDDNVKRNILDGFIVYRLFSCPGGDEKMYYPLVTPKDPQQTTISTVNMPPGCSCSYQVSAFGKGGESARSAPQQEKCTTSEPIASVNVIFNSLNIDPKLTLQPVSGEIYLSANQFSRYSDTLYLKGESYDLSSILFNGEKNNNKIVVNLGRGKTLGVNLNFYVTNLCQGAGTRIEAQDFSGESLIGDYTITSSDGLCKLQVSIRKGAKWSGKNQGDANVKNDGGTCKSNDECYSGFCDQGVCAPVGKGGANSFCFRNSQCASGICSCVNSQGEIFACPPNPQVSVSGYCTDGKANSEKCSSNNDCASNHCANGICAPKDGYGRNGDYCHHNNHCASGYCLCRDGYDGDFCKTISSRLGPSAGVCIFPPGYQNGDSCSADDECMSNHCANGKCAPRDGTGLGGEYCHHDNHCASNACWCPTGDANFWTGGFCPDWEKFNSTDNHGTCISPFESGGK